MAQSFEESVNFSESVEPRSKRSDLLLRQLYHEEVDPPFRVPHMKVAKMLLMSSLISIIVLVAAGLFKYNNFIALREAVYAKNGNLNGARQRRSNLFSNLINLTLSHAQLEHEVFNYAALMRSQTTQGVTVPKPEVTGADDALLGAGTAITMLNGKGAPMSAEQLSTDMAKGGAVTALAGAANMPSSLGRLMAVAERYPEIRSSETYQLMMKSLIEIENQVSARRVEWHAAIQDYNRTITGWPWNLLANMTGFKRIDYFAADAGAGSAPAFSTRILYGETITSPTEVSRNNALLEQTSTLDAAVKKAPASKAAPSSGAESKGSIKNTPEEQGKP